MNRLEFEMLRDIGGKRIEADIALRCPSQMKLFLIAEDIPIFNPDGLDLRLNIRVNPTRGSKTFNVVLRGTGPICRLDVDGPPHRPAGGTHKHSLQRERCPAKNLPRDVQDLPGLSGLGIRDLFDEFCSMASIEFSGSFEEQ